MRPSPYQLFNLHSYSLTEETYVNLKELPLSYMPQTLFVSLLVQDCLPATFTHHSLYLKEFRQSFLLSSISSLFMPLWATRTVHSSYKQNFFCLNSTISLLVFPRFAEGTNPQPKLGFFRICGVYYGDDENRSFECNYVSTMYPAPRPFSRRTLLLPIKPLRRLKTIAFKSLCQSLSLDTVPAPWSWSTQGSITIIIKLSMFNLHKYYNKNF